MEIPTIHLASYDFLFLISSMLSLLAAKIHRFFDEDNALSEEAVKNEIRHAVIGDIHALIAYVSIFQIYPQPKHSIPTNLQMLSYDYQRRV